MIFHVLYILQKWFYFLKYNIHETSVKAEKEQ